MSSSDDDVPLSNSRRQNGANGVNGTHGTARGHGSSEKIPKSLDTAMDNADPPQKGVKPGISIRNGPADEMDIDGHATNGTAGKRKARQSAGEVKDYRESSDDEDDKPLSKRRRTSTKHPIVDEDSDSDDQPIAAKKAAAKGRSVSSPILSKKTNKTSDSAKLVKQKAAIEKHAEKEAKAIQRDEKASKKKPVKKEIDSEDDSDVPIAHGRRKSGGKDAPAKKANGVKKEADLSAKQKAPAKNAKAPPESVSPKKGAKKETSEDEAVEEEEDEFRWWEDPNNGDDSKKWSTLEHAGVVFPPEYEPLPANVKMKYDGVPVTLHPEAEEVAGFFGGMLNSTVNVGNPTFCKNFFSDFKEILATTGGAKDSKGNKIKVKDFAKCDFTPIFDHFEAKRAEKKAMSKAEKDKLKAEKEAAEAPFLYCTWDGRKEKVGNFRVEPPSLFRGRGEHPKTGHVKKRVKPEQITINIGKEATVPTPPPGHRWKEVKHDQAGTWLAMWQENINGAYKYVMLAANSTVKGQSDFKKFEKARELKKHIARIRADYKRDLKAELTADRQKATAMYLIDELALRAGNEKGEDEAETVGCCSLKYEHITLTPPNTVVFDFLGKDSIRYYDSVKVDQQVFKNLKIFKKAPKCEGDQIFDRLSTSQLNAHLRGYMDGLTAKVFRTYNASYTMSNLLQKMHSEGSIAERVKDYNDANRQVAILCNHKRTVGAAHETQMGKMTDRIKGLQYQKWRIKHMMLDLDPKLRKKKGAEFFQLDEDLSEEWVVEHQKFLVDEMRTKIEKKFAKENEKLVADGGKEMKAKELTERLSAADELASKFKRENKTKKVEAEGRGASVEKLESNLAKLDQRIDVMRLQAEDRESNKEVALGTSKINYIDPRLTVVFSKKFNVPIEKFFNKTLRAKFDWAIKSVDETWTF